MLRQGVDQGVKENKLCNYLIEIYKKGEYIDTSNF